MSPVHWFEPTGRVTGIAMLVLWVLAAVIGAVSGAALAFEAVLLLAAVVTHATVMRPRLGVSEDDLVFRGMFSVLRVPLVRVDTVRVARYFEATVGEQRFISPAVSRSRRKVLSAERHDPVSVYTGMVEDDVRSRIFQARARSQLGAEPRAVRRSWDRYEIAALVGAAVLFVVLLAV